MKRFLAVMALAVLLVDLASAQQVQVDTGDPFDEFWENVMKHPFPNWGDGTTTWDKMMRSVELGGYLRVRYETTNIETIQRVFGPSPTGPRANLGMVGDEWADWVAYKALFTIAFNLTPDADISFYGSLINMNVLGDRGRFRRTGGGARVKSPQMYDPEVALYEGYVQWKRFVWPGVTARVGRQELVYGDQWLLSNNSFYGGLSYDAAKLSMIGPVPDNPTYTVDFFAAQVSGMFANPGPSRPQIFGGYATFVLDPGIEESKPTLLDVYLLHNRDNMNALDIGSETDFAKERRYTIGSRLAGYFLPDIDYSLQGAYQFGRAGQNDDGTTRNSATVQAYAAQGEIGKSWPEMDWTPRISLGAAYASGDDDPGNGRAKAFNPLFQDPHGMHGLADVFHFTNLIDYCVRMTANPHKDWTIGAEGHIFRSDERISAAPGTHVSKRLGNEIDFFARLKATDKFALRIAYAMFAQGNAFRDTTGSRRHDQRIYFNIEYFF